MVRAGWGTYAGCQNWRMGLGHLAIWLFLMDLLSEVKSWVASCDLWHGYWIFNQNFLAFFCRHSAQSLPTTFIGLEKWLQELWREKDVFLQNFYGEERGNRGRPQPVFPLQYVSLAAWLALTLKILLMLLTSWCPFHWLWIFSVSVFMALISKYTNGLQEIEADLESGALGFKTIVNVFVNLFKRNADPKRD